MLTWGGDALRAQAAPGGIQMDAIRKTWSNRDAPVGTPDPLLLLCLTYYVWRTISSTLDTELQRDQEF